MRKEFLQGLIDEEVKAVEYFADLMKAEKKEADGKKTYTVKLSEEFAAQYGETPLFKYVITLDKDNNLLVTRELGEYKEAIINSASFREKAMGGYGYEIQSRFYEAMEMARLTEKYVFWVQIDDEDEAMGSFLDHEFEPDEAKDIIVSLHQMADLEGGWYRDLGYLLERYPDCKL